MKPGRVFWFGIAFATGMILGAIRTRDIWFERVAWLTLIVIAIAYIWARISTHGISIQRNSREYRQHVGQYFKESFKVVNRSRFGRLWVEVIDQSRISNQPGSKVISRLIPHEERTYVTRTHLVQRGVFPLGPIIVSSGDPFGFFRSFKTIEVNTQLLVYPYFSRLDHFPALPGYLSGGQQKKQKTTEVTPYAAGVREFQPGDPISRIHWRTTARRDRVMVKEFEQDPQSQVWILIDCSAITAYGQETLPTDAKFNQMQIERIYKGDLVPPHTFDYLVSAAASVADYYIRHNCNVGLATSGETWFSLPIERSQRQLQKILEVLTLIHCDGQVSIAELVEAKTQQMNRGSTVVLFTSDQSSATLDAIHTLSRKKFKPILVIADADSFGRSDAAYELRLQSTSQTHVIHLRKGESIKHRLEITQGI